MTDYNELVKALRLCQFGECGCDKCRYKELKGDWCTEDNHPEFFDCDDKLKLDAAAAIEALQAEMPKRGKWIEENRRPRSSQFVCSECHRTAYDPQPTRDKAWRKRCKYAYCPNCGADMRKMEVQE